MGGSQGSLAEAATIGRICEEEMKRLDVSDRAELRRVTAENAGAPVQAETVDILPEQPPALHAVLHEQGMPTATRQRLQPDRTGAGEQVDHAGLLDRLGIDMADNVEQIGRAHV